MIAKCHTYQDHFNTGTHQAAHGYYPQVVWAMNQPHRANWLRQHIAKDPQLIDALFKTVASTRELTMLIQQGP